MQVVYRGHRAHVLGEVARSSGFVLDPWGFLLDSGEVAWHEDLPAIYSPAPSDDEWAAAHYPLWRELGGTRARCTVCGHLRAGGAADPSKALKKGSK
jgi:hypothetical protein